jgi:hypothetical protein
MGLAPAPPPPPPPPPSSFIKAASAIGYGHNYRNRACRASGFPSLQLAIRLSRAKDTLGT